MKIQKEITYTARINRNSSGSFYGAIYCNGVLSEKTCNMMNEHVAAIALNRRIDFLNLDLKEKIPKIKV